jgi:quercetin dioxygenase-like cupin family protein
MEKSIFPKGSKASREVFTGTAYVNMLVTDTDKQYTCQVYDVVFEAGARNNWHKHPGGQLLLVTDGKGYYQERGKAAQLLQKRRCSRYSTRCGTLAQSRAGQQFYPHRH